MTEVIAALKSMQNAGIAGLIIWLIYKLVDKWAPLFLAAQERTAVAMTGQATAMTELAAAVRGGVAGQEETLMAVRVLAREISDMKGYLKEAIGAKER